MKKICIIGSGSWGVAIGIHAANTGNKVIMWAHSDEECAEINKNRRTKYLPNVTIPQSIKCTTSLEEAIKESEIIFHVTPSKYTRETMKKYKQYITNQPVIICSKGFESSTLYTLSEVANDEMPNVKIGVFSGPSHAEEVGRGIPTTVVVGAKNKETAEMLQDVFMNKVFRVYTSSDIVGIELGGALKNVIALAAGTVDGLGYGDNTKAALMTRGIAELTRLGEALGGKPETFSGLTGVGDLIVTCTSVHSRNRKAGYLMGKGMTAEEAMKEVKMVVEGVYSAKAALGLAKKCNVAVPIVEAVNRVLFENADPKEEVSNLLLRERKQEHTNLEWS